MQVRPAIFVGSSSEGLPMAQAVQVLLDEPCEVELWNQGVFGLAQGTLEALVLALDRFDFAVLILTPDDLAISRDEERAIPRDNVLFELGLFTGALGRDRTFMIYDRTNPPSLPTDLAGITAATFEPHASGNLRAALGAACAQLHNSIQRLGVRPVRSVAHLEQASQTLEGTESRMRELIRLLARSRKVELDIISTQFGPLISPEKLERIREDIRDLERTLDE